MAHDSSLYLRKAVIRHARADTSLIALVADRIYRKVEPDPQKPFVRYGTQTKLPAIASGQDGALVQFTMHGFSDGDTDDEAALIGAALARSLDGLVLDLTDSPYPAKATITWTGGQTLPDPEEASVWHEVQNFEAMIVS